MVSTPTDEELDALARKLQLLSDKLHRSEDRVGESICETTLEALRTLRAERDELRRVIALPESSLDKAGTREAIRSAMIVESVGRVNKLYRERDAALANRRAWVIERLRPLRGKADTSWLQQQARKQLRVNAWNDAIDAAHNALLDLAPGERVEWGE